MSAPTYNLSRPEHLRVLEMLAEGKTGPAIARAMGVSHAAVKSRLSRIYQQLGAQNAAHAVAIAGRWGLLPGTAPEVWTVINDRHQLSDVVYLSEDRAKQAAISHFLNDGVSYAPFDWVPSFGGLLGEQAMRHDGEPTGWRVAIQIWADAPLPGWAS